MCPGREFIFPSVPGLPKVALGKVEVGEETRRFRGYSSTYSQRFAALPRRAAARQSGPDTKPAFSAACYRPYPLSNLHWRVTLPKIMQRFIETGVLSLWSHMDALFAYPAIVVCGRVMQLLDNKTRCRVGGTCATSSFRSVSFFVYCALRWLLMANNP
jgi:hypothetical protein